MPTPPLHCPECAAEGLPAIPAKPCKHMSKLYSMLITRDITESCVVVLNAEDADKAEDAALDAVMNGLERQPTVSVTAWRIDDDSLGSSVPYLTDGPEEITGDEESHAHKPIGYLAPDSFTPGPWEVVGVASAANEGQTHLEVHDPFGRTATVYGETDDPETHATAALIARAPDMDAALREIIDLATSGASPERLAQIARKIVHPDLAANFDEDGEGKE